MPLIRTFAVQGHPVPKGYTRPRGPFPPELYARPESAHIEYHTDSLHEALDDVRMFRCKLCSDVVFEDELAGHTCDSDY